MRARGEILTDGHHRKQLDRVRERLGRAIGTTCRRLRDCGLALYQQPEAGMFVWARRTRASCSPGNVFSLRLEPSAWLRFNVAFCGDSTLYRFLERVVEAVTPGSARAQPEAAIPARH